METYRLGTPRNVSQNKQTLTNKDIIDYNEGNLEFVDPAFEIWFNNHFL